MVSLAKATSPRSKQKPVAATSTWDGRHQQPPPKGLTLQRIIAAGIALADQYGLAAVSIRRIAAQLDSRPMALYHYFPTTRDLLNLILDELKTEFEWPAVSFTNWRSTLPASRGSAGVR